MNSDTLLVANRGEIAIRILRSAGAIRTVAVAPADDIDSLHTRHADVVQQLPGRGSGAYLDIEAVVSACRSTRAQYLHPGYGFLSENPALADACTAAGITFVGPSAEVLALFGDKVRSRALAAELGIATPAGTSDVVDAVVATEFARDLGRPVIVKAAAGGGGRGMEVVDNPDDMADAIGRCRSEALLSFGDGRVLVEEHLTDVRHIEVQVIGDGVTSTVLGDRDCSIQRRRQKLVEIAPAVITDATRTNIHLAATRLADAVGYKSLGTFEFLVDDDGLALFIEANARIQVEHTITEELLGLDLVELQLAIAAGATLTELGLDGTPAPRPNITSVQLRINAERIDKHANVTPSIGTIAEIRFATGPGIRIESGVEQGSVVGAAYDSLLAKLIVTAPTARIDSRITQALAETAVTGVDTSLDLLRNLATNGITSALHSTQHLEQNLDRLAPASTGPTHLQDMPTSGLPVAAPTVGIVVSVAVEVGDEVVGGAQVAVIEAMKMERLVLAPASGVVTEVRAAAGDSVEQGQMLVLLEPVDVDPAATEPVSAGEATDPDQVRPDLAEVVQRHDAGLDSHRQEAVAKRRKLGRRTARENVSDLLDDGSFVEYGPLVLAAQRKRRSVAELIEKTPGDGLVGGIGTIGADNFDDARVAVMTYDYTVLAGTQGTQNHRKKDRLFELAERWNLPMVVFAEGGGGRPGDTDGVGVAGLDCLAFWYFAKLSGRVPLVGINTGYCFAGNAALIGMCDVIISTKGSNLGMGGPAMIEGGGLGTFHPSEVGPTADQYDNGVIDILVDDDEEAVVAAQKYLGFFQGSLPTWEATDQRLLRHIIPENRLRIYSVRDVVAALADTDSVLELGAGFGPGMVTSLARIEGRAVGVIANDPAHLAGAIDSDGANKASRFMRLCSTFGMPVVFLCDTPGIMVGPEAEKSGTVRHASRMFIAGASLDVPFCTIVLRKGYGLGAQAMAGGSFKAPMFTVSWPTGEFGGMGLEGAVQLGYRNELDAIDDPEERAAAYQTMVDRMYTIGKALNFASVFEIDDVIDPADTRSWIVNALLWG